MNRLILPIATAAVLGLTQVAPTIAAPTAAPRTARVSVNDDYYRPNSLTVKRGTKVVWAFRGSNHNVTVDTGPTRFHSPTKSSGTFAQTLRKPGRYVIYCTLHSFQMVIRVK